MNLRKKIRVFKINDKVKILSRKESFYGGMVGKIENYDIKHQQWRVNIDNIWYPIFPNTHLIKWVGSAEAVAIDC